MSAKGGESVRGAHQLLTTFSSILISKADRIASYRQRRKSQSDLRMSNLVYHFEQQQFWPSSLETSQPRLGTRNVVTTVVRHTTALQSFSSYLQPLRHQISNGSEDGLSFFQPASGSSHQILRPKRRTFDRCSFRPRQQVVIY